MDSDPIALFRFQVIAPLLAGNGPRGELKRQILAICAKPHAHPTKGQIQLGCGTVEEWYYLYRKDGLGALCPQRRKDKGRSRRIGDALAEQIVCLVQGHPDLDGPGILAELKAQGQPALSLSSLYRFIKARQLHLLRKPPRTDRRAYAFELPGDCWQCDVMYGPSLPVADGKRRKTYLLAILDDATRLIAHAQFYFEQHLTSLKDCLKQALLKRGLPKRLYVDNGRIFRSRGILLAAAQLGFHLIHARPYQPEGKAKLERFFGTVRRGFLARLDANALEDLGALNRLLFAWIEKEYHHRPHGGLEGQTPWDCWIARAECVRALPPEADLEWIFLERVRRRVGKDGTLSVKSKRFEAGPRFIGQMLELRYDPYDLRRIWLVDEKEHRHPIRPLDLFANRHAARAPLPRPEASAQKPPLRALERLADEFDREAGPGKKLDPPEPPENPGTQKEDIKT